MTVETSRVQLPPGTGKRTKGVRKGQLGIRAPDDLERYIEALATRRGLTKTALVLAMLYNQKDLAETMGDDWWEVERRAGVEESRPGIVVGELARRCLHHGKTQPGSKR